MARNRYDETWHRLREWTNGQTPSERLAGQILIHEGFTGIDPSHPLGGRDGAKDAIASKDGSKVVMAVYFPRGAEPFKNIRTKFSKDFAAVSREGASGYAFVTNQELTLGERAELRAFAEPVEVHLFHLERITTILDAPEMAQVRQQFLSIEAEETKFVSLGGRGGNAPGAGGGGGGVFGSNSTGGNGGSGGDMFNLNGISGTAPGAGGGGAGVIGEGAIGGEGGGGGEQIFGVLGPEDLRGVHHFDIQVGKGGINGPGEDSIINLCDENGRVIRHIVAKGGIQGAPPYVPPPSRKPTADDLQAGLRINFIFAAEMIRFRDLWTIVDGGWDWIKAGTNPFKLAVPILVEIQTGTIEAGTVLDLKLVVLKPDGFQTAEHDHQLIVGESAVHRSRFSMVLELVGSEAGLWKIQVLAGDTTIGDFSIEVRLPSQN